VKGHEERLFLPKKLIARAFGISVQSLERWDIKPHKKQGREVLFYLPEVIEWRLKRDTKAKLDLSIERARLASAQADKTEFDLKISHGEYIHKDTAAGLWEKVVMAIRSKLLSLPTKMAPLVLACNELAEAKEVMDGATREILTELSGIDPADYANAVESEPIPTVPKAGNESVGGHEKNVKSGVKRRTGQVANQPG
jgi:hypothetical protein